jgi:hypothetical protein
MVVNTNIQAKDTTRKQTTASISILNLSVVIR